MSLVVKHMNKGVCVAEYKVHPSMVELVMDVRRAAGLADVGSDEYKALVAEFHTLCKKYNMNVKGV